MREAGRSVANKRVFRPDPGFEIDGSGANPGTDSRILIRCTVSRRARIVDNGVSRARSSTPSHHRRTRTTDTMQSIAASNKIAPANASVRPTSAKAARRAASIVPNATQDSKGAEEPAGEESNFWKKMFLADGKEEVSSADYQKFQAEMAAKKAANKEKAAAKEGGCVIM